MPSSLRQRVAIGAAVSASKANPREPAAARVTKLDGARLRHRGHVGVASRNVQRRKTPHRFTRKAQSLATGRQDGEIGGGFDEELGNVGDRVEQVLTIVEHQQHSPLSHGGGDAVTDRDVVGRITDLQDSRHGVEHGVGCGSGAVEACQLHQECAVGELIGHLVCGGNRQSCLADAAGAGQ